MPFLTVLRHGTLPQNILQRKDQLVLYGKYQIILILTNERTVSKTWNVASRNQPVRLRIVLYFSFCKKTGSNHSPGDIKFSKSYLSDRKQYVSVNGSNSSCLNVTCGVPQGSVLGPLLFLIYINDLPRSSSKLTFYLFADDTNIYYESNNLDILQRTVKKRIEKGENVA